MSEDDFLDMVQEGINEWAKIVIFAGGNIKIAKCHAKLNVPRFDRGQCNVKDIKRLLIQSFTVPQMSGPGKPIKILNYSKAKNRPASCSQAMGNTKGPHRLDDNKGEGMDRQPED